MQEMLAMQETLKRKTVCLASLARLSRKGVCEVVSDKRTVH